jgi:electron transport complex protein RnfB
MIPMIVLCGIGLAMAALLAVGRKAFSVEVDPRQERINDILPGANCGGCGYPGCSGYASALVDGTASPTACAPGGADLATEIGAILGVEVEHTEPMVALVACAGTTTASPPLAGYIGEMTCAAAHAISGAGKACTRGCLGLGSCIEACKFDAIVTTPNGLVIVIPEACTGCGNCVEACPRGVIRMVPKKETVHVLCVNPDKPKMVKAVCSVGCTGCKLCLKQSKRFELDGTLAHVTFTSDEEIPESAALACPQGTILDGSKYTTTAWITDPSTREEYNRRSKIWKDEEKKRKAKLKEKKASESGKPPSKEGGES